MGTFWVRWDAEGDTPPLDMGRGDGHPNYLGRFFKFAWGPILLKTDPPSQVPPLDHRYTPCMTPFEDATSYPLNHRPIFGAPVPLAVPFVLGP